VTHFCPFVIVVCILTASVFRLLPVLVTDVTMFWNSRVVTCLRKTLSRVKCA